MKQNVYVHIILLASTNIYLTAGDGSKGITVKMDPGPHLTIPNGPVDVRIPLNIHIPLNVINSADAQQSALLQSQQLQSSVQNTTQNVTQNVSQETKISAFFLKTVVKAQEKATQYKKDSVAFITTHKTMIGIGAIVSAYLGTLYFILSGNNYLQNPDLWSEWNAEMGDEMLAIPQQEVAQALVHEIQMRYVNGQNPADFISPFIAFVHDIEEEQKWLNRYHTAYSYLSVIGGTYVFPFEEEYYVDLEEKMARLAYLKNIYYSWIAAYKLVQNTPNHEKSGYGANPFLVRKPSHAAQA